MEESMKILKKGKVVPFKCLACDGEFTVGIKVTKEDDGNYYANCPMCGNDCHSTVNDINEFELAMKGKSDKWTV